jgi:hypothetical protein
MKRDDPAFGVPSPNTFPIFGFVDDDDLKLSRPLSDGRPMNGPCCAPVITARIKVLNGFLDSEFQMRSGAALLSS